MWWSRVATTWSYRAVRTCSVMAAATAAPPATARLPPSQKSFWTSTTISARLMRPPPASFGHRLQRGLPPGECPRLLRQRGPHPLVVRAGRGEGLGRRCLAADLTGAHQGDDEVPVARARLDRGTGDHLGDRRAAGVVSPDGVLAAPHRVLALGPLGHRHPVTL